MEVPYAGPGMPLGGDALHPVEGTSSGMEFTVSAIAFGSFGSISIPPSTTVSVGDSFTGE